jgi:phosphoenolpyruvate carboxylase
VYTQSSQLLESLLVCFRSLCDTGNAVLARGALLDTIRRVRAFGLSLLRLDVRQESERHAEVLDAVTRYLDIAPPVVPRSAPPAPVPATSEPTGPAVPATDEKAAPVAAKRPVPAQRSYLQWTEEERISFLVSELESKRPLIPSSLPANDDVKQVLATFKEIVRSALQAAPALDGVLGLTLARFTWCDRPALSPKCSVAT